MEEKAVCYYCATVYPADQPKCPLCGSTKRTEDFVIPQRRERITDEERKRRQKGGRYATGKKAASSDKKSSETNRKPLLIAALVFLALAVLILFWFIADMIGWLPGFENTVDRETQPSVSVNTSCTELLAEPTRLSFNEVGKTQELCLSVNNACEDKLYCSSNDPSVVTVSESAETAEGIELKSVTFTITAVAEGTTTITVTCGNQTMGIPVSVGADEETTDPTDGTDPTESIPSDYMPELNRQEISFSAVEESIELNVTNLPEGATVTWTSGDEGIASVSSDGVVTAIGAGETTITCDVNGITAEAKVICTLEETKNNRGAHLETTDATVRVGESFPLYLYDSEGEHIDEITYVVDNSAICEVKDNRVTAIASGTTKVRVIFEGEEFICIVRVG